MLTCEHEAIAVEMLRGPIVRAQSESAPRPDLPVPPLHAGCGVHPTRNSFSNLWVGQSVKFRCALASGVVRVGSGACGGGPFRFRPVVLAFRSRSARSSSPGALHSRKTGWVEHIQPIPSPQPARFLPHFLLSSSSAIFCSFACVLGISALVVA